MFFFCVFTDFFNQFVHCCCTENLSNQIRVCMVIYNLPTLFQIQWVFLTCILQAIPEFKKKLFTLMITIMIFKTKSIFQIFCFDVRFSESILPNSKVYILRIQRYSTLRTYTLIRQNFEES